MSGRRVQHLVARGRGFQVRLPVPADVQCLLRRKELRWSVRTRDPKLAARRVLNATLAFHELCDKLRRMKDLSIDDAREIAQSFYHDLAQSYRSPAPIAEGELDYDAGHQEAMAEEFINSLESQVQSRTFKSEIQTQAITVAEGHGFQTPPPGSNEFRALCEGIARAQVEHARFTLFRQSNILGKYSPQDELFVPVEMPAAPPSVPELQSIAIEAGLPVKEAVDLYISAYSSGPRAWKPRTRDEKIRILQIALRTWGEGITVDQITSAHVRDVRDLIEALKPRAEVDPKYPKRLTAKEGEKRLNPKTSGKYFSYVKSFLIWLDAEGYIDGVPGASVKIAAPKPSLKKPRRPFTQDEMNEIFSSPLYSGFSSRQRRYLPGKHKAQDGLYWVYLIGLYTGMREGELIQLTRSDLHVDYDVPFFDIRGDLDLKTEASVRRVPIHPDLFDFGLREWLEARKKKAEKRLFFEIKLGPSGNLTAIASKKLNKYLVQIGVKTGPDLTFHSFRHAFIDAMRSANVPEQRLHEFVGHKDKSVTGGYGQGANLQALGKLMNGVDFGLNKEVKTLLIGNAKS